MTIKNINILYSLVALAVSSVSTNAMAGYCDPVTAAMMKGPAKDTGKSSSTLAGECSSSKNVYQFSGSAKDEIDKFGTDIEAAGNKIADTIAENTASEIEVITQGTESLIKAMVNITNSQIKDQLKQDKMLLDMKMDYLAELQERELKASQGVMGMDDTAEEVLFIINELKVTGNGQAGSYNHAQELIASMKANYDDNPNFLMPIRIKSADAKTAEGEGCPAYDPVLHKSGELDTTCFYTVKSSPGAKLEKYFKECSIIKANSMASVAKNMSKKVSTESQQKSQTSYMNKSQTQKSTDLIQTKIVVQKETSCSVKEFGYKICGTNEEGERLDTKEYLQDVVDLKIIPYGNVSSSNFLSPVSIGSTDGNVGEIDDATRKSMALKAVGYKTLGENGQASVATSSNTPPIVKTYKTSSQYFAAVDFVNNIINKEAVSGQNVTKNTNSNSAIFQSKFMSRAASLSLAENSMRNAIELRTGSNINQQILKSNAQGESFNRQTGFVREDVNGAGSLDVLINLIDKDYNKLQSDAKSVISGGGTNQIETAPDKITDWQVEALIKSNQLALMQFEQNERIELLMAAILANTINSENNVNYINSLKVD